MTSIPSITSITSITSIHSISSITITISIPIPNYYPESLFAQHYEYITF